jgi:putative DNA primase/helicase
MSSNGLIESAHNHSIQNENPLPENFYIDGRLHRYCKDGSTGSRKQDNWYVAYEFDHHIVVNYGTWVNGLQSFTYRSWGENKLDRAALEKYKKHTEYLKQEQEKIHQEAVLKAKQIWESSEECSDHPYLTKKGVKSHGLRVNDGQLLIPIYDAETDQMISIQRISADGDKRFLYGSNTKNGYFTLGELNRFEQVYLSEGYATAATAHEATSKTAIIAFSSHNCTRVALHLRNRNKLKTARLLHDIGDAGDKVADEWKEHSLGDVCTPNWGETPREGTDWNDLAKTFNNEEVARQLAPKSFQAFEIGEFLDLPSEPFVWAIENMIQQGSINLVFAEAGVGKSMVSMHVAIACQLGLPIFRDQATRKQDVLFVDAELPQVLLKERWTEAYRLWGAGMKEKPVASKLELLPWLMIEESSSIDLNLYQTASQSYLDPLIEQSDLIFLDNFDKVTSRSGGEEDARTDEANWQKMFKWLRRWKSKGKTFVIVGHTSKAGVLRGTGKIGDDADTSIQLKKLNNQLLPSEYHNSLTLLVAPKKLRGAKPEYAKPFAISLMERDQIKQKKDLGFTDGTQPWEIIPNEVLIKAIAEAKTTLSNTDLTKLCV